VRLIVSSSKEPGTILARLKVLNSVGMLHLPKCAPK
jgi:hypothetical protein